MTHMLFEDVEVEEMPRELQPTVKRPRISVDVDPETRRQIRLAAAQQDIPVRQYVLQAIRERLARDLGKLDERDHLLALTAQTDPVLAELWDNEKDAAYNRL